MNITFEVTNIAKIPVLEEYAAAFSVFSFDSPTSNLLKVSTIESFKENTQHTVDALVKKLTFKTPEEEQNFRRVALLIAHNFLMLEVCKGILIGHIRKEGQRLVGEENMLRYLEELLKDDAN